MQSEISDCHSTHKFVQSFFSDCIKLLKDMHSEISDYHSKSNYV